MNELARETQYLQCESRKAKHHAAIAMAHINPWLAASQLGLPTCSKLTAAGNFAIVKQCEVKNISFFTEITKCGATLRYGNYTLHPNGYELTPFTPCTGNVDLVHVAGAVYHFNGTDWKRAEPTRIYPQHELAHLFKYRTDNTQQFIVRNLGVQEPATDYISQYANIAMDRHEAANSIKDLPVPGSWWASIHKLTSWWDVILYTLTVTASVIAALITAMLLTKIGAVRYIVDLFTVIFTCAFCKYGKAVQADEEEQ